MSMIDDVIAKVKERDKDQPEFIQAVEEVLTTLKPTEKKHPEFVKAKIYERIVEPDRSITFRVVWQDDNGEIHINRGYRVQFNGAIGPYKGGLRFHPSVNIGIIKFLGFEQIFKNALTGLPMGGAKGGSDFDPRGRSDSEVMRFSYAFMQELYRYIGPDTDVPAGDIGVGAREIGYLYGMYKKIVNEHTGVLTGKGLEYGGSLIRPEATGYGIAYFTAEMLASRGEDLKGKTVIVSGFGNVAWGTVKKVNELGGNVVAISGPDGYVYDPEGIKGEKVDFMLTLRASGRDVVAPYAERFKSATFVPGKKVWEVKCDIAIPCATQNELNEEDAQTLVKNGVMAVTEGANMPCTLSAVEVFRNNGVLFGPAKAANAGGVAVSGLEMTQNSMRLQWTSEEVDNKLRSIMKNIYRQSLEAAEAYGKPGDLLVGANIAGFLKVAKAMLAYGAL